MDGSCHDSPSLRAALWPCFALLKKSLDVVADLFATVAAAVVAAPWNRQFFQSAAATPCELHPLSFFLLGTEKIGVKEFEL